MSSLPTGVVVNIATISVVGQKLPAPGTWGSLVGVLYFAVVFDRVGVAGAVALNLIGFIFAALICGEAEVRLNRRDPGEVILDEVIAMPFCFIGWSHLGGPLPPWAILAAGFAVFRFFDILKPLGIRQLQSLPGGWGVVVDDIAAALITCAVLHGAHYLWIATR